MFPSFSSWSAPKGHNSPSALWRGRSQAQSSAQVPRNTEFTPSLHPWVSQWPSLLCHTQHLGTSGLFRAGDFSTDSCQGCRAFPQCLQSGRDAGGHTPAPTGTGGQAMADTMSWAWSQSSHCHQRAELSKRFEIRKTIPTEQPRQLKQSSREIPDWAGLSSSAWRWGTLKSCTKPHSRTAPGTGGDGAEAPLGTNSARSGFTPSSPRCPCHHTWGPADRQGDSQALKNSAP